MSELIIFSRHDINIKMGESPKFKDCNCLCHKGIPGHYHCWVDCCEFPDSLWNEDLPDGIKRALENTK